MEYILDKNVSGRFYVDSSCVSCGLCVTTAPDNFKAGIGQIYVFKQPQNPSELEKCLDAFMMCPTSAIKDSN